MNRLLSLVLLILILLTACNPVPTEEKPPVAVETHSQPTAEPLPPEKQLQVHYMNVGDGDAILLIQGTDAMVIDGGAEKDGTRILSYLKSQGIESLAYMVATHPFKDHIGGLPLLLKKMPVGTLFMPDIPHPTKENIAFTTEAQQSGATITFPDQGDSFSLGDAKVTVLSPSLQDTYENLANQSLVLRVTYGKTSFLFMGDAMREVENKLLDSTVALKSDVLKVGRHGSSAATTSGFLDAVDPSIAIISCEKESAFLSNETLSHLEHKGIHTFRTDQNGTIVVTSDGTKIQVRIAKE